MKNHNESSVSSSDFDQKNTKLTIGQISTAFNLSNEALRYYEKKNLITPFRCSNNNYRYYDYKTIQRIGCLKRMQNQAFSLDEITSFLNNSTLDILMSSYQNKLETLDQEIQYKMRILCFMKEQIEHMNDYCSGKQKPNIVRCKAYFSWQHQSVKHCWNTILHLSDYANLLKYMPLTSFSTFVDYKQLSLPQPNIWRGLLISEDDLTLLGIEKPEGYHVIPAGNMLHYVQMIEDEKTTLTELISPCIDYMSKHKIRPSDNLFTRQLVSFIDKNNKFNHLISVYLPFFNN
ncbi:MAG: MerR family transcriptional regulator [Christensenellales bacterium]|jgi:DNA-binding transcriptional MerR regulator